LVYYGINHAVHTYETRLFFKGIASFQTLIGTLRPASESLGSRRLQPALKLREETIVPPKVVIHLPERRKPIFDTDTFIKRT
jgi:hypothetical protein